MFYWINVSSSAIETFADLCAFFSNIDLEEHLLLIRLCGILKMIPLNNSHVHRKCWAAQSFLTPRGGGTHWLLKRRCSLTCLFGVWNLGRWYYFGVWNLRYVRLFISCPQNSLFSIWVDRRLVILWSLKILKNTIQLSSRFSNIDKKFEHLFECLGQKGYTDKQPFTIPSLLFGGLKKLLDMSNPVPEVPLGSHCWSSTETHDK